MLRRQPTTIMHRRRASYRRITFSAAFATDTIIAPRCFIMLQGIFTLLDAPEMKNAHYQIKTLFE
jgi:hypothetical protein